MKTFLHSSGAIAIGLIIGAIFTFPFLVIGTMIGWLYISEEISSNKD